MASKLAPPKLNGWNWPVADSPLLPRYQSLIGHSGRKLPPTVIFNRAQTFFHEILKFNLQSEVGTGPGIRFALLNAPASGRNCSLFIVQLTNCGQSIWFPLGRLQAYSGQSGLEWLLTGVERPVGFRGGMTENAPNQPFGTAPIGRS